VCITLEPIMCIIHIDGINSIEYIIFRIILFIILSPFIVLKQLSKAYTFSGGSIKLYHYIMHNPYYLFIIQYYVVRKS